jgi:large subunit ribosomal protein L46
MLIDLQAAERVLIQALGINMNTWMVGNHPIGHHTLTFRKPEIAKILPNPLVPTASEGFEQEEYGEKVFFMKGRILAGQADLSKNELGDKDFQWLAKEEVQAKVDPQYWKSIRNMLTER